MNMNQNVKMGDVYRENEGKQKTCIFWFPLKPLPQAGNPQYRALTQAGKQHQIVTKNSIIRSLMSKF